ncbi:MAG: hypothetical protein J6X99_06425 [Bacteroidales bacterium]|nr:hypothetical protein [Bacteroidales bacterium]
MMKSKIIYLFACAALLVSCGCEKKRDLPDVDPSTFQRYSQDNVLNSKVLNTTVKYNIYFPASYATDKDKRYPVVYMVHGYGDDNNSWNGSWLHANNKIDDLTQKGLGEMIYVFPQGFKTYYCNRYDGTFSYMDMFVNELIPLIDGSLRTIPDKQLRAVTGYSMGGFGAVALAEKHPELFIASASLSMSVRTDWQYMEESQDGWNSQWGKIFGGFGQTGEGRITEYYKQHCPLHYFNAQNKSTLSKVNWYFICGDNEENLLYANDELHCILRENGYAHQYRVVDGGHSSYVWMPALDEVLPMFDYYMNGGSMWSPDDEPSFTPGSIETEEDGSYLSPAYKESSNGTAVFVAHNNLSQEDLQTIMAACTGQSSTAAYALLPCNTAQKTLQSWMSEWEAKYPNQKKYILGVAEGAREALALPSDTFSRSYYLNPAVGDVIQVAAEQEIYFAGTELDSNYKDMDKLYVACKGNEAAFQYRIVRGYKNASLNLYNSLKSILSYLTY